MLDVVLLLAVLVVAVAAGAGFLAATGWQAEDRAEGAIAAAAAGLGLLSYITLGLAAAAHLRLGILLGVGAGVLVFGARPVLRLLPRRWPRPRWWEAAGGIVALGIVGAVVVCALAPAVGGDQTKYQLVYPKLYARAGRLVDTPWSFWGSMQYLVNFLFAAAFTIRGDALARLLNIATGVLAALALYGMGRRHLSRPVGGLAALLFFTMPITCAQMMRAWVDLGLTLFALLGCWAFVDWWREGRRGDLGRAALMAGFAAGSKIMGLLVPALLGIGVLVAGASRCAARRPGAAAGGGLGRALAAGLFFGAVALAAAAPCYLRNALTTGNPIYPFGYRVFGGTNWSGAAADYLDSYYRQYRATYARRRRGGVYEGAALVRFPWDLTMHPDSFENGARPSYDLGPVLLAFLPALVVVRKRRRVVLALAAFGAAYVAIVAVGAWAHPRYVLPGLVLLYLPAAVAMWRLLGRRPALLVGVAVVTVAGNLLLSAKLLAPRWPDQLSVALGRMSRDDYLRRHSSRYPFWAYANGVVPPDGRVLVLAKIPHPYYIERPYVLASYLEQGLIDYRTLAGPRDLAARARSLGVTHVAVKLAALSAAGDPFEARVTALWREFLAGCEPMGTVGGYRLYRLPETGVNAGREGAPAARPVRATRRFV